MLSPHPPSGGRFIQPATVSGRSSPCRFQSKGLGTKRAALEKQRQEEQEAAERAAQEKRRLEEEDAARREAEDRRRKEAEATAAKLERTSPGRRHLVCPRSCLVGGVGGRPSPV